MARHILIVEDSQVDRARLEQLLSTNGFPVSLAENGEQAIASVKRSKPDAILMDVNMPGMDGFAATRALRGDATNKDIPAGLGTPKDQKADKAWGQMLGARGYVTKPYSDDQVLAQIRSL